MRPEIGRLEREASHLVRFFAEGGDSALAREELRQIEATLGARRLELATLARGAAASPQIRRTWILAKLQRLDELLLVAGARNHRNRLASPSR